MSNGLGHINADPDSIGRDLGRLVLTIIELLRQLTERQALRRVEVGDLPEETVENLGLGLMLWVPRTVSRSLISAFMAGRPHRHRPEAVQHDHPLWPLDSPT